MKPRHWISKFLFWPIKAEISQPSKSMIINIQAPEVWNTETGPFGARMPGNSKLRNLGFQTGLGVGGVSEKMCSATDIMTFKFFPPPFLALLGGKKSDPP